MPPRHRSSAPWVFPVLVAVGLAHGSRRALAAEPPAPPAASDAAAPLPPNSPAAETQAAPEAPGAALAPNGAGETAAPAPVPPIAPVAPAAPEPVPAAAPATAPAATVPAAPPTVLLRDEMPNAGYVPGYRRMGTFSMSPYAPRVGSLPGGLTPSFGAPSSPTDWTFQWNGFMSASLQFSSNQRGVTNDHQSSSVFHAPPATIDEYASFVGTSTMPGQWVQLSFKYGNSKVSANVQLTTYNPSDPSTYYALGSQQFINNAYLSFNPFPIGAINFHASLGYFYNTYGNIGQYGPGMYTNPLVAGARGIGENLALDYDLSDTVTLAFEDGFMGTRNGTGIINVIQTGQNGSGNAIWPAAWVHHAHLGIEKKGGLGLRARLHYFNNWAQDDRTQRAADNPTTSQLDESYVKDGSLNTYGFDASISSPVYGYLGFGASYVRGRHAYPLKGMITFGGDGETLTNRWWGPATEGTGKLVAAALNYSASLARIVSNPVPFDGNGPDIVVNAGAVVAESWTDFGPYDRRFRNKYGADVLYTFLPYLGAGVRFDRVVPNSKDSAETFHVLAPRLVFRTKWQSRESITLLYAKWFYGQHSHPEASSINPGDRLDDQLFALNAQMWW